MEIVFGWPGYIVVEGVFHVLFTRKFGLPCMHNHGLCTALCSCLLVRKYGVEYAIAHLLV